MLVRFSVSIVFSIADQSGGSEMISICKISYVYMACHLKHSSTTAELPVLSLMLEENGCWLTVVNCSIKGPEYCIKTAYLMDR